MREAAEALYQRAQRLASTYRARGYGHAEAQADAGESDGPRRMPLRRW